MKARRPPMVPDNVMAAINPFLFVFYKRHDYDMSWTCVEFAITSTKEEAEGRARKYIDKLLVRCHEVRLMDARMISRWGPEGDNPKKEECNEEESETNNPG